MHKELLYKYFRAETSADENKRILDWIDTSDENRKVFLSERQLWTLLTLHVKPEEQQTLQTNRSKNKIRKYILRAASVAAVLLIAVGAFWLYDYSSIALDGMQTISVPAGQRTMITLVDGTNVWLNSNTTFSYPADYNEQKREVNVNGEAYFEVAKNKKSPFTIHTEKSDIEVLGTTFNVYDYAGFDMFSTSVVEGSVKVSPKSEASTPGFILKGDEKLVLTDKQFVKQKGTTSSNWREGVLVFNNTPIDQVLGTLSAYYGMDIIFETENMSDYHCTAKFSYNDGLDYILRILQKDLHYTIQRNQEDNVIVLK